MYSDISWIKYLKIHDLTRLSFIRIEVPVNPKTLVFYAQKIKFVKLSTMLRLFYYST